MQINPAKRRLSGPARTLVASLRLRMQQGRRFGAFDQTLEKEFSFDHLF